MSDNRYPELPRQVLEFITQHIDSVEQLEILVLLKSTFPARWTVERVTTHLQSSKKSVAFRLTSLIQNKLVHQEGSEFLYNDSSHEINVAVDLVIGTYKISRIRVIEFIFSKPNKIISSFLNAFKHRKDE